MTKIGSIIGQKIGHTGVANINPSTPPPPRGDDEGIMFSSMQVTRQIVYLSTRLLWRAQFQVMGKENASNGINVYMEISALPFRKAIQLFFQKK